MAKFNIPSSDTEYTYSLTNLLGVDYTDTVVDNRRSPNMVNFINNNGFLETRYGHKILFNVDNAPINGVWNIDANNDIFVVHCGTKLYEVSSTFNTKVLLETGIANVKSTGIYLENKLLILDGVRARVYGKFDGSWQLKYLDAIGYIPITTISTKPDGTKGQLYESANLCTPLRINSFLSDGTSTVYQLDGKTWQDVAPVVTKLTSSATWEVVTGFTFNHDTGQVTFSSPIEVSPSDGVDNVQIKFTSGDVVNYTNKCTFATVFGYNGNNNRVFIAGNVDFPNVDWYSDIDDITYFPVDNYSKLGTQPITGYSRMADGVLAIQKKLSDTDCTVYYRTFASMNSTEVFPLTDGVKNIGCLTNRCNFNLLNDPMFLSEEGVYSIVSTSASTTNERFAQERSYYVRNKLMAEANIDNAVGVVHDGKYYIAINNHVYIADSRQTSKSDNSTSDYQYEWFYWENMPVSIWFTWNNKLYFGDSVGNIRTFATDYNDESVVNSVLVKTPVNCYWESSALTFRSTVYGKTISRMLIQHSPIGSSRLTFGYIDNDGSHDVVTSTYDAVTYPLPLTVQEKEKVRNFMYLKFYVKNNTNARCSFSTISAQYILSGNYRGD